MTGWETTGRLDLSRPESTAAPELLAAVRARLSDLLGLDGEGIVLTTDPDRVRSEWRAAGGDTLNDQTGRSVSALRDMTLDLPALIAAGPADSGLCALVLEGGLHARSLRRDSEARIPPLTLRAALSTLAPAGLAEDAARAAGRDAAMTGVMASLQADPAISEVRLVGDALELMAQDRAVLAERLRRAGLVFAETDSGYRGYIPDAATARQAALALGAGPAAARQASRRRSTRETDILVAVDLDGSGARIHTGLPFYDHMLEQIAAHGGFGLTVAAEGDLTVDAHHTIEDVALALGESIAEALGDKKGIGRYGFTAPMDEAQATIAIDLSGRPLSRFEGSFARDEIGGFPTEMTPHVFRSLADSLRAAVHVKVEGEDDHHKVEACFKGFGRALRQAILMEGGETPSTKGVL